MAIYSPVDEMTTRVKNASDKLLYTQIEPNRFDSLSGYWVRCDKTVTNADIGDNAKYKSSNSKLKVGYKDATETDWMLGFKTWVGGVQYLARPLELVSGDTVDEFVRVEKANAKQAAKNGDTVSYGSIFDYCSIECKSEQSGVAVQHTFTSDILQDSKCGKLVGVRWELNDIALLDELTADPICNWHVDGSTVIEYFDADEFLILDDDGNILGYQDVTHNYSTVSGSITSAVEWTAGTYYVSGSITIGAGGSLNLNAAAGRIAVKPDSGLSYVIISSSVTSGEVYTSNTSYTNDVYITSKHDDAIGETISGSTGSPATGDYGRFFVSSSVGGIQLQHTTIRYAEISSMLIGWSGSSGSRDVSFKHGRLLDCALTGSTAVFFGSTSTQTNMSITLENVKVDSSNSNSAIKGHVVRAVSTTNASIKDCFLEHGVTWHSALMVRAGGNGTFTIQNNVMVCNSAYAHIHVQVLNAWTTSVSIGQNVIDNDQALSSGIILEQSAGSLSVTLRNSTVQNCITGISTTGTVSLTHDHNNYYNNTSDGVTPGATDKAVNPTFGNLPGGTIETGFAIPDGYSVGNATLQGAGSDTYDNLGIDEAVYSPDGNQKAGADTVWIAPNYAFSAFVSAGTGGQRIKRFRYGFGFGF